jgi:hypothetical protein
MILTDADKVLAKELNLTQAEYRLALACHIAPRRWAEVKAEIAAEGEARQAHEDELGAAILDRAAYAPPGRGHRPALEEPSPEEREG